MLCVKTSLRQRATGCNARCEQAAVEADQLAVGKAMAQVRDEYGADITHISCDQNAHGPPVLFQWVSDLIGTHQGPDLGQRSNSSNLLEAFAELRSNPSASDAESVRSSIQGEVAWSNPPWESAPIGS